MVHFLEKKIDFERRAAFLEQEPNGKRAAILGWMCILRKAEPKLRVQDDKNVDNGWLRLWAILRQESGALTITTKSAVPSRVSRKKVERRSSKNGTRRRARLWINRTTD